MFDGIKGAVKGFIERMGQEEQPLSLFSESKAAAFSFDTVSAGWYARNGYYGIYNALSGGPARLVRRAGVDGHRYGPQHCLGLQQGHL
jgi:hypothetical protein